MATEENVNKFISIIDDCLQTEISELLTSSEWGKFNFEDVEDDITKLFQMLNHFKTLPIKLLPDTEITNLETALNTPKTILGKIRDFSIDQQNPKGVRDSLAEQIVSAINTFYVVAHIWIPYLAYQKGDVQKNIEALNTSVKKASKILEATKTEVETKKQEIDSVVLAAKEASATVGVGHFSSSFETEATALEGAAKKWLQSTIGLAAATFAITITLYWLLEIKTDASAAQIVQVLSTKIILITLFFTATLWAGKMYKATMHQMILNKHRANSLKTFQAFIKASNEISTRDAVLMETTKSIFSVIPSGYLENEQSGSGKNTNIIEIIKTGSDIAKKTE